MNILEKIDQALTGRPQKPKNPIEVAAETICELSVPRIKSAMGSRYAEAKKIYAKQTRPRLSENNRTNTAKLPPPAATCRA